MSPDAIPRVSSGNSLPGRLKAGPSSTFTSGEFSSRDSISDGSQVDQNACIQRSRRRIKHANSVSPSSSHIPLDNYRFASVSTDSFVSDPIFTEDVFQPQDSENTLGLSVSLKYSSDQGSDQVMAKVGSHVDFMSQCVSLSDLQQITSEVGSRPYPL